MYRKYFGAKYKNNSFQRAPEMKFIIGISRRIRVDDTRCTLCDIGANFARREITASYLYFYNLTRVSDVAGEEAGGGKRTARPRAFAEHVIVKLSRIDRVTYAYAPEMHVKHVKHDEIIHSKIFTRDSVNTSHAGPISVHRSAWIVRDPRYRE